MNGPSLPSHLPARPEERTGEQGEKKQEWHRIKERRVPTERANLSEQESELCGKKKV
jgi:hypothetical protein